MKGVEFEVNGAVEAFHDSAGHEAFDGGSKGGSWAALGLDFNSGVFVLNGVGYAVFGDGGWGNLGSGISGEPVDGVVVEESDEKSGEGAVHPGDVCNGGRK